MTNIAIITNSTGATIVVGNEVTTLASDHPNYVAIQDAAAAGDAELVKTLMSIRNTVNTMGQGVVRVENDKLYYGDREIRSGLARRIIKLMAEGRENFAKPLIAFMENVMLNPSYRAVEGLFEWLERSNLPITPDGHFIAWKIVRHDYLDHHSATFDNSVGQVVEIARNEVDEDPDRTCSNGLHFCSNEYLPQYGGSFGDRDSRIMMVKVNPKDVGAFPKDYNVSKGRCCRYEVIGEVSAGDGVEHAFDNVKSGVFTPKPIVKTVARIETRSLKDRQEIDLVFTDGTRQKTKTRLGNTLTFRQDGNKVILVPSNREILITG